MVPQTTNRGSHLSRWLEALRASFGFLSGVAMVAGIALGLGLPAIDDAIGTELPVLAFESQSSARSLLETIGTATVSVAGLSFSVTIVAFTLASSQLSPRVLRTFRGDRLSQVTLALFLGTFIYCLTLLVRLGVSGQGTEPPNVSITLAVLLAFASFLTFAIFIAHIISMLQPSTVIEGIHSDVSELNRCRFPAGPGEPADPDEAAETTSRLIHGRTRQEVRTQKSGYLTVIKVNQLIDTATEHQAIVRQVAPVGKFVLEGQLIAEVFPAEDDDGASEDAVRGSFVFGDQRTMVQDIAFGVRQLADIALKGLSPGINDPTTAENAMDTMGAIFIEFIRADAPSPIRVGPDGEPRLIALAPDLGDLVRLGFDQVRVASEGQPTVNARLLELLSIVGREAGLNDLPGEEIERQQRLILESAK